MGGRSGGVQTLGVGERVPDFRCGNLESVERRQPRANQIEDAKARLEMRPACSLEGRRKPESRQSVRPADYGFGTPCQGLSEPEAKGPRQAWSGSDLTVSDFQSVRSLFRKLRSRAETPR